MTTTLSTLNAIKMQGGKFACISTYDAAFAYMASTSGIEVILVGDSLGMVLQGHDSTLPVTVEQMAYHVACVKRGNQGAHIMADMPFMSYATEALCLHNAALLMQAGAHSVKLEGGRWLNPLTRRLTEAGIPVCVHLGLTPQSVNKFGGYKVQGRDSASRALLIEESIEAQASGAAILLYECIPADLMADIMTHVSVPVIGIGAGPSSDGQVLVMHDILGMTPGKPAKFVRNFMPDGGGTNQGAVAAYAAAVKEGSFPGKEHCFA